jgi:hypothetical protein
MGIGGVGLTRKGVRKTTSSSDLSERRRRSRAQKKFKSKIKSNQIDIEYLNQCLKSENAYVMEGQGDEM